MKQTPSAIIVLAATVLGACAMASLSIGNQDTTVILALLAVPMGIIGLMSLIKACLHDHRMSLDAASRLEFLEELVYLERLSLERRERARNHAFTVTSLAERETYDERRKRGAA